MYFLIHLAIAEVFDTTDDKSIQQTFMSFLIHQAIPEVYITTDDKSIQQTKQT